MKKSSGRPVTIAADETVTIRLPGKLLAAVDAWAASREATRSEAIRKLLEQSLEPKPAAKRKVEPWVKRAADRAEARSKASKARRG